MREDERQVRILRIKEARLAAGLTQTKLAEILGIAGNTLCQYETGTRAPSLETLKKLADYFNVTVDYLIGHDKQN